jgi:outer membrane protein assembly factor BamB
MLRKLAVISVVLGMGVVGITSAHAETDPMAWTTLGYDSGHSGFNPTETAIGIDNVAQLTQRWRVLRKTYTGALATVADGVVYTGDDHDGTLNAFSAASGKLIWSTPGYLQTGPTATTVANGVVYSAAKAFDAATGALLWSHDIGYTESSPVVVDGVDYVGSYERGVYAYDATTGAEIWTRRTHGPIYGAPAVADGVVYVGSTNDHLYAFDAATGATVPGGFVANGGIVATPVVVDGVVYAESQGDARTLYAADAHTGHFIWRWKNAGLLTSPAVANGLIYLNLDPNVGHHSTVVALSAADHSVVWRYNDADGTVFSPTVANGVLYTGNIEAHDSQTGALLWRSRLRSEGATSPTVSSGQVYVETIGLYAFSLP